MEDKRTKKEDEFFNYVLSSIFVVILYVLANVPGFYMNSIYFGLELYTIARLKLFLTHTSTGQGSGLHKGYEGREGSLESKKKSELEK